MEIIKLVAIGIVLGISMVIPGLSAATMAVAFNIYDRLINVIVPNLKKIFGAWQFWLPLAVGGVIGILLSSKVLSVLFESHRIPTYWFFIGVIAGSIPIVYSKVLASSAALERRTALESRTATKKRILPSVPSIICCVIALALMVFFAIVKPNQGMPVHTELTLPMFGILVLSGLIAATAMIIPGISGSFMLLVIGMYETVLKAVSDFTKLILVFKGEASVSDLNILLLIPFIIGAVAGLLLCAAFIRFLLAKVPQQTYGVVLGLVVGSIVVLFPGGFGNGMEIIASIVCLLGGFALSFFVGGKKEVA